MECYRACYIEKVPHKLQVITYTSRIGVKLVIRPDTWRGQIWRHNRNSFVHLTVRIIVPEVLCAGFLFAWLLFEILSSTLEAVRPREIGRRKKENVEIGCISGKDFALCMKQRARAYLTEVTCHLRESFMRVETVIVSTSPIYSSSGAVNSR